MQMRLTQRGRKGVVSQKKCKQKNLCLYYHESVCFVYFESPKLFGCRSKYNRWAMPSEFGAYRLCEQQKFRQSCASTQQSHQNLRCSLIQAVSQEEPLERKPDPWPLRMAGHAQLKFVMTECSKTQIRLTGLR